MGLADGLRLVVEDVCMILEQKEAAPYRLGNFGAQFHAATNWTVKCLVQPTRESGQVRFGEGRDFTQ